MPENRWVLDWQKNVPISVTVSQMDDDLDAMAVELIRLHEQVKALEKAQSRPDNAFWGQLIFDVFMILAFIALVWRG